MNEIDQLCIFGQVINPIIKRNFISNATPLIKGKKATFYEAIELVKKKIKNKEVHFSNLSCDLKTIDKVLEVSEKRKFSLSHSNQDEINNFYLAFQKFGGSIVSLNEVKKRADLLIIIGDLEEKTFNIFLEFLKWNKTKVLKNIFSIMTKGSKKLKNIIIEKDISDFVFSLGNATNRNSIKINEMLLKAKYPVVIIPSSNDFFLNEVILRKLQELNEQNQNVKMSRICGLNNASGFVNSCVMKSGFPGPLNFTDWGISYEPFGLELADIKKQKEVQFLVSNFSDKIFTQKFKINILIGNPSFGIKEISDVFIPTKTPGIDTSGLVLRSDGNKVIKLQKKIKTNYMENVELLEEIFN